MQFLKSISSAWGGGPSWNDKSGNGEEVAQLREGELYIVRTNSAKGSRECLFPTALATVQRTEQPFHYQLVITRAYQEGEAELLDDIDDDDEESRIFPIEESLAVRIGTFEGSKSLIWRDLDEAEAPGSAVDENLYEFVAERRLTDAKTFEAFYEAILRAMYERKTGASSMNISAAQLREMFHAESVAPTSPNQVEPLPATLADIGEDEYLDREKAKLYLWNHEHNGFMELGVIPGSEVEARVVQTGQFQYWLMARANGHNILGHQISDELNGKGNSTMLSFTWNYYTSNGTVQAWCLRFDDQAAYTRFCNTLGGCIFEVNNAMDWSKIKEVDQDYVITSMTEDVDMVDADAEEEEVEGALADEESTETEDERDVEAPNWGPQKKKAKNSGLAVGHKGIAVVLRGDQLGIFKETTDGNLELGGTVNEIKGPGRNGKSFAPKKIMLHDRDRKLVMMNPDNAHALYQMDLETGKVVEEWKIHDDVTINAMTPLDKLAQITAEQTLLGASHNAIFQIDPRLSGNKMVDSNMKQYVTKNKFSSLATTEKGHIAVASEKGDIRLFDTLGKNAKTALPALGDPIKGVDVTKDGRWVIATCKTYLLLIDTQIQEGKYTGDLGFTRSFPANAKPKPARLRLKPEHVAAMGSQIDFSPAKFNTGPDAKETAIITSVGEYVIAWNFEKVKKGKLESYQIKKYTGNVVEDNFSFGNDKEIIVTLQDDVLMIPKKALKRPGRESLGTQPAHSRSSIVNAPY